MNGLFPLVHSAQKTVCYGLLQIVIVNTTCCASFFRHIQRSFVLCSRYNLKQRLDGDGVISEDSFERLIENFADNLSLSASSDDESDLEENSGTEDENDDKRTRGKSNNNFSPTCQT